MTLSADVVMFVSKKKSEYSVHTSSVTVEMLPEINSSCWRSEQQFKKPVAGSPFISKGNVFRWCSVSVFCEYPSVYHSKIYVSYGTVSFSVEKKKTCV